MTAQSFLLKSPDILEGIGPERAKILNDAEICTIADMFAARAPRVHKLLGSVSTQQVGKWFCAAMLLRIEAMTPALAEVLVDAEIRSVDKIADTGLQTLELAARNGVEAGKIPSAPSIYKLADLQRDAWRIRNRGMVTGQIENDARVPISGAHVELGSYEMDTDDKGRFAFDAIPEGKISIVISVAGYTTPLRGTPLAVLPGKLTGPIKLRTSPAPATIFTPTTVDEFDGELVVNTARTSSRLGYLRLDEFREGTYFLAREFQSDGRARLLSLYKHRTATIISIDRVLVAPGDLPTGTQVGDVLLLTGGRLEKTSLTPSEVAQLKRDKWEQTHSAAKRNVIEI